MQLAPGVVEVSVDGVLSHSGSCSLNWAFSLHTSQIEKYWSAKPFALSLLKSDLETLLFMPFKPTISHFMAKKGKSQ